MATQTKAQPVFKPIFNMVCPQSCTSMVMEPQLSKLDAVVSGTSVERGERGAAANGRDLEAGAKDRIAIEDGKKGWRRTTRHAQWRSDRRLLLG